jgi:hypothetical protein
MTGVQFLAGSMNALFVNEIGPALPSIVPQIQRAPFSLTFRGKELRHVYGHSPMSSAEVKTGGAKLHAKPIRGHFFYLYIVALS